MKKIKKRLIAIGIIGAAGVAIGNIVKKKFKKNDSESVLDNLFNRLRARAVGAFDESDKKHKNKTDSFAIDHVYYDNAYNVSEIILDENGGRICVI